MNHRSGPNTQVRLLSREAFSIAQTQVLDCSAIPTMGQRRGVDSPHEDHLIVPFIERIGGSSIKAFGEMCENTAPVQGTMPWPGSSRYGRLSGIRHNRFRFAITKRAVTNLVDALGTGHKRKSEVGSLDHPDQIKSDRGNFRLLSPRRIQTQELKPGV